MELQDMVTVTLTEHGAQELNERNKAFNNAYPRIKKPFKTDYKEGDVLTSNLYDIISRFEGEFNAGCDICFKNIIPAEPLKEISDNDSTKKKKDESSWLSPKEVWFKINNKGNKIINLNGLPLTQESLEDFGCTAIYSGYLVLERPGMSKDKSEEFVSIEVYDMLANAYNAIFDECVKLRAKLAQVKDIIENLE